MAENNKKSIAYHLLHGITYLHALLPLWVLYILSDIMFVCAYYVVGYRRKIVRKNLNNAFPSKSKKEILKIEKDFYRHLCDYFVETVKTLRLTDEEVRKRMKFENPEIINRLTKSGNSCLLSLGHYGNWEWVPSVGLSFASGVEHGLIYKQLHSDAFDALFLKIRTRFGSKPIEMKSAFRTIIRQRNEGRTMVIGFLSDQRPEQTGIHYWTTFLNQDTSVQTGMERIARQLGFSIVYLDIKKVKRGYYVGKFYVITPDASQEPRFTVTERYMRKLEETVLEEPAYYLWSHNRWCFTRNNAD